MPLFLYLADAAIDAEAVQAAPGAVAVCDGRVVAAGDPTHVRHALPPQSLAAARVVELPGRILLPGLVNSHAHLDLTSVGSRDYIGNFSDWVKQVIRERPVAPADVVHAVAEGIRLSREAGVLTIGDIASSEHSLRALMGAGPEGEPAAGIRGVRGVSFAEIFGIGPEGLERAAAEIETALATAAGSPCPGRDAAAVLGIQPHAPYSVGSQSYAHAVRTAVDRDLPLATHLAETPDELEFVADATGPFRDLLQQMGKWSDAVAADYNAGLHPVAWLERATEAAGPDAAAAARWLCAHCNYIDDADIAALARRGWSVAYCPRASDYFGHSGHRYRDMLEAGVNVCLGTDSIICHGTLSILDEMRHLHRRDGVDPRLLLQMATTNGMRGLGLDPRDATLSADAAAGLIAVRYDGASTGGGAAEALRRVLQASRPPRVQLLSTPAAA